MAKVTMPLLGVTAHGTLGKGVTFRDHVTGPTAARWKRHRDFQSDAQLEQRDWFRQAAAAWQELSEEEKAEWNAEAVGQRMSGYNLFISQFVIVPAWDPTELPGLQFWFDDDVVLWQDVGKTIPAVADGDVIGYLEEQSGTGRDPKQPTSAKKPLLKLNQINGKKVVRFDGTDDYLDIGTIYGWTYMAYFFVLKSTRTLPNHFCGVGGNQYVCFHGFGDYTQFLWSGAGSGRRYWATEPEAHDGEPHIHTFHKTTEDFTGVEYRIDGGEPITPTSTVGSGKAYFRWFGAGHTTASVFEGDMAAVIICGSDTEALSSDDRELAEAYLASKYGITLA